MANGVVPDVWTQVARGDILLYFNQIFVGLCKLFADVDVDVKNGSNLLDRLIKVSGLQRPSRFGIPAAVKRWRRTPPATYTVHDASVTPLKRQLVMYAMVDFSMSPRVRREEHLCLSRSSCHYLSLPEGASLAAQACRHASPFFV